MLTLTKRWKNGEYSCRQWPVESLEPEYCTAQRSPPRNTRISWLSLTRSISTFLQFPEELGKFLFLCFPFLTCDGCLVWLSVSSMAPWPRYVNKRKFKEVHCSDVWHDRVVKPRQRGGRLQPCQLYSLYSLVVIFSRHCSHSSDCPDFA